MARKDRGREASECAAAAARRAAELAERLTRLQAGETITPADLAAARAAAESECARSLRAHDLARQALLAAEAAHRSAADALEAAGQHDAAEQHRRAAATDATASGVTE
jgi:hypothetical protein